MIRDLLHFFRLLRKPQFRERFLTFLHQWNVEQTPFQTGTHKALLYEGLSSILPPIPHRLCSRFEDAGPSDFVFIREPGTVERGDLRFRYEQILRLLKDPEKTFICCASEDLSAIPYLFHPVEIATFLVPKAAEPYVQTPWSHPLELAFRLVERGFRPISIPILLAKPPFSSVYPPALYPTLKTRPHIQVIIPYRDQEEVTRSALRHLKAQEGVDLDISFVDNQSKNLLFGEEMRKKGFHVLRSDEPFNYSRLNNLAVSHSKAPYILFLNNDVDLAPTALAEMARFAQEPCIGIVGALLEYPNGLVQHGGIHLKPASFRDYSHTDWRKPLHQRTRSRFPHAAEAVTAACAMIRREVFHQVGGFDEVFFPIAYSDVDLCERIRNAGYLVFFTPEAKGIHHESLSRGANPLEDFDRSHWYHHFTQSRP